MVSVGAATNCYDAATTIKLGVHFTLYCQTIINLGKPFLAIDLLGTEKHKPVLQRGMNMDDIGSFSLTELCHGSNVKDIQTTATYDPSLNEFIVNTPAKEDMKFWIGATA